VIVHVVMIEPRANLSEGELTAALQDLENAASQIRAISRLRVGRRIRHGLPGYEQSMTRDYSYLALIEFDDHRGLQEYLQHPAHERLSRHFATLGTTSLAYDYETNEVPIDRSADREVAR
jgi:hypothetical protein